LKKGHNKKEITMAPEKDEPAIEQVEYAKKFTMRDIGFDIPALKEVVKASQGKPVDIVSVLAFVTGKKVEPSRKDPSKTNVRFQGQFECVNLLTEQKVYAAEGFFPGAAEPFLTALKDGAKDEEGNERAARTAFVITVQGDKTPNSAQGYKFGCKPFVNKSESTDIFKDFRKLLPKPKARK
jgi:hypothetical protein